jgi:hypothetical protein
LHIVYRISYIEYNRIPLERFSNRQNPLACSGILGGHHVVDVFPVKVTWRNEPEMASIFKEGGDARGGGRTAAPVLVSRGISWPIPTNV